MSNNYAKAQPLDRNQNYLMGYPAPASALASYGATVAASSVITLTDNTTVLEVTAAGGAGVAIKWISTGNTNPSVISSGATANFDHIIANGQTRRFVVPIETIGNSSIVGANKQNGLFNRVAWNATTSSASVFGTEF
jgi:hypothetical protein